MGSDGIPLGTLLAGAGALDDDAIADVLAIQQRAMPFASVCYALGSVDEETLVSALSRQHGLPGIVFDRSVIRARFSGGAAGELLRANNLLCFDEDEHLLYVAAEDPTAMKSVFHELEFMKGKTVVPHVALFVTLARAVRECARARDRGDQLCRGPLADPGHRDVHAYIVSEGPPSGAPSPSQAAYRIVFSDVTSEVPYDDLVLIDSTDSPSGSHDDIAVADGVEDEGSLVETAPEGGPPLQLIDFDDPDVEADTTSVDEEDRGGKKYVLIVDEDVVSQQRLASCLHADDFMISTTDSGAEAIRIIRSTPPDAVIMDVMLPGLNGLTVCRSMKQSVRYRRIPVLLMSAVVDSGKVSDDELAQNGADAYFEKPVSPERIRRRLRELLSVPARGTTASPDDGFDRALELYRAGNLEQAVAELREGLEHEPESAKHHFVLANLLQKQARIYEAIDEYEATIELRPNYFPALTRLAYLYYRQGFAVKAIEIWRRALPHCPDPALRENIELFMRKLIADMHAPGQPR